MSELKEIAVKLQSKDIIISAKDELVSVLSHFSPAYFRVNQVFASCRILFSKCSTNQGYYKNMDKQN